MRAARRAYACIGMAGALAYPFCAPAVRELLYLALSVGVVGAVWVGSRTYRPSARTPWLLLTAGVTCTALGDLGYSVLARRDVPVPFPSVLDGLYLMFYPLVFLAFWRFLRASGKHDQAAWVDASIWTIGVAALLWEPVIEPYVLDYEAGLLAYVLALAYPLLDLALLLMALRMVAGRASLHPAFLLLTSALIVQVVIDFAYGVRIVEGTYVMGELTDVGWMLINVLVGVAALHPSMVRLTQPNLGGVELSSRRRLQLLLVPALGVPALVVYQLLTDEPRQLGDGLFAALATAGLLILVVTRGGGVLRVAEARSAELSQRSAALERSMQERERVSSELRQRVDHDPLTGLASRELFVDELDAALAAWRAGDGRPPSIAFFDLDDFKTVNNTLGHEAGDLLLVEIAGRLQRALSHRLVARFGGDEFAVLTLGDAEELAERLLQVVRPALVLQGRTLTPQLSIGLATARVTTCSTSDLLREADVAMYTAKRAGGGWTRYRTGMSAVLLERVDMRNRLVQALQSGEVEPWFQPVVDLVTGRVVGFETLARWCPPAGPVLDPAAWLPLAEESGLITDVDRIILHAAVAQLASWEAVAPGTRLHLAINLSGRTLQQPGVEDEVIGALRAASVDPSRLVVEVTEGVLIDDEQVSARLQRLRAAGVRISLDDFGTGWSSLSYLRRFPVDQLKLDRTFTADLGAVAGAQAIPSAVLHLARGLSLGVVAEGVETADQRRQLVELGFRVGQGHLFGRALCATDVRPVVAQCRPQPAGR